MTGDRLRAALREAPVDPAARDRALRVALAAYRERAGAPAVGDRDAAPRPRRLARPALALAACVLACAIVVAAVGAPGDALARWVRDVLGAGREDARPALVRVPGGGRLLATAPGGAWVVSAEGSRRRLGGYDGASWSPNGWFAVVWRGRQLKAVEPGGAVRWAIAARRPVRVARWAPVDGFRIAYVAGDTLRVVDGDGTGDRAHGRARPVAPAWRPDAGHVLASVDARGRVRVRAVDARRELWRTPALPAPRELAWSADGRRLLVATARGLRLYDRRGQLRGRRALVTADVAWAPRGRRLAVVGHAAGRSEVLLLGDGRRRPRVVFTGPGRFGPVAWSPAGRRLLVPWPDADQWLFLAVRPTARTVAVGDIARQFAPGPGPRAFPERVEWCCSAPLR